MKSTVDDIRRRFDADVERFSNLDTGQSATVDAPLALALVAEAAAATTPHARHVLDVGCGAGNYTLKLLESLPNLDATLIDLSQPMLDRARERVSRATAGRITTIQADIREARLTARLGLARPARVCDILQLDTSTLSRNVKPLQAHGWLEVVPDEDARAQPFRLTPQGRRLIEKAVPAWEQAQRQATELLGDEGIALLDRAAKKLRRAKAEG
jgi:DNA-binding MarR family transcriptional regulator